MFVCALCKQSRNQSLYFDKNHSHVITLPRWRRANSIEWWPAAEIVRFWNFLRIFLRGFAFNTCTALAPKTCKWDQTKDARKQTHRSRLTKERHDVYALIKWCLLLSSLKYGGGIFTLQLKWCLCKLTLRNIQHITFKACNRYGTYLKPVTTV